MGEESKVRVKNDAPHRPNPENPPHRHSRAGGKPQGGDNKTTPTTITPLSLDVGEESKARVKTRQSHHPTLWFPACAGMTVRDAGMTGWGGNGGEGSVVWFCETQWRRELTKDCATGFCLARNDMESACRPPHRD